MGMGRVGWVLAPITTGALALGLLSAGPGAASDTDTRAATAPTSQGSWGTPIRLMNSLGGRVGVSVGETWNEIGVGMDARGNGVAFSALDFAPGVDEQGRLAPLPNADPQSNAVNTQANLVMRYVDGAWQEPEVIAAPMSLGGSVTLNTSPTVSVSPDGYAAIVAMGEILIRGDFGFERKQGIFISTSHDITQQGSFTPWREVVRNEASSRLLRDHFRVPLAVGTGGNVITGYTLFRAMEAGSPCAGSSYVRVGLIRDGTLSLNPEREVARCHIHYGFIDRTPIDVAISGTTATVAYQEGEPGCAELRGSTVHCTQVDLQTLNMATGVWSAPARALPQATLDRDDPALGLTANLQYEDVRVAASSGGTAVVARINRGPGEWQGYYINIPPGTTPDVSAAVRLQGVHSSDDERTAYYLSDVVISADGTALAAYEVETCEAWNYLSCALNYRRSFQVLEFTPRSSTMHVLTPAVTTNWASRYSSRIAMSLPPNAPLSRAVIAYTRSGPLVDDVQQPSYIETQAYPFTEATRSIVPAPQGELTTPHAWHWAAPAVAASSSGAGLVLFRPDAQPYRSAAQEVWVSGLSTANRAGIFPPQYVEARIEADKRISVIGMRPFFYPEGGGEPAFFNNGAQARATMEVLVKTGPAGYRVTDSPVCTTTFARDSSDFSRDSSMRGRGTCAITADLPSGTYTFVARTSLDGRVSAVSAPSNPVNYTAATPPSKATITIQKVKRGKGKAAATVTVKGRTKGLAVREIITLQLLTGRNTWTNSAQYLIQKGGRFTAKWRRPAAHTFRFVHEATGTVSAQRTVKAN